MKTGGSKIRHSKNQAIKLYSVSVEIEWRNYLSVANAKQRRLYSPKGVTPAKVTSGTGKTNACWQAIDVTESRQL